MPDGPHYNKSPELPTVSQISTATTQKLTVKESAKGTITQPSESDTN